MNYRLTTRYEELCLAVTVQTLTPAVVTIRIVDEEKPNTVLTDRYKTISGQFTFYVRMPITPKSIVISVFDKSVGNIPNGQENNIKIVSVEKQPLQKRLDLVDISNPKLFDFVDFAQRFCFNAYYLQANKSYESDGGNYLIEYLPQILGRDGQPINTPARISRTTGRIQISKEKFDKYTVPMRFAILCHEFSHFYVNENMADESEADLNGLLIYLSLGYPRIEAHEAFLKVFMQSDTVQNMERHKIISKFIDDFEKNKIVIKY